MGYFQMVEVTPFNATGVIIVTMGRNIGKGLYTEVTYAYASPQLVRSSLSLVCPRMIGAGYCFPEGKRINTNDLK